MATHGVLSDPAVERLSNSPITRVVLTNTLPLAPEKLFDKVEVLSVAKIIADALAEAKIEPYERRSPRRKGGQRLQCLVCQCRSPSQIEPPCGASIDSSTEPNFDVFVLEEPLIPLDSAAHEERQVVRQIVKAFKLMKMPCKSRAHELLQAGHDTDGIRRGLLCRPGRRRNELSSIHSKGEICV